MGEFMSSKVDQPPQLLPLNTKKSRGNTWDTFDRRRTPPSRAQSSNHGVRYHSIQLTVRTLQLDHTKSTWASVSYVVAFMLLIVVPIFQLLFIKSVGDMERRQLVFQPLVMVVGVSRSLVSFVFLSQAIRRHGLNGFLFLDSVAEEVAQVRKDYDTVIERGSRILVQIVIPCFILYVAQLVWLFMEVSLEPLPFHWYNAEFLFAVAMMCLSWVFQTTTYLYACVLFGKVCKLQELKMRQYYDMLLQGLETEYYVLEYDRIKRDLKDTSHRFRAFLAFTGVISVSGTLISMYEVVDSINAGFPLCLWGELFVLTVVNLTGAWLCLNSASKLAHLHRRIVKRASFIHTQQTLSTPVIPSAPSGSRPSLGGLQTAASAKLGASGASISALANKAPSTAAGGSMSIPVSKISADGAAEKEAFSDKLDLYFQRHEAWARRAAIVEFLSSGEAGISVYGFILDRFFVHTSLGALLTTTWLILGRSLQT